MEADNEAGHHGHDATFKHLMDHFYWLNLFDDVAFFVVSCVIELFTLSHMFLEFIPVLVDRSLCDCQIELCCWDCHHIRVQ